MSDTNASTQALKAWKSQLPRFEECSVTVTEFCEICFSQAICQKREAPVTENLIHRGTEGTEK
jgi:hypothetical protein